jgi:hypothetical protein
LHYHDAQVLLTSGTGAIAEQERLQKVVGSRGFSLFTTGHLLMNKLAASWLSAAARAGEMATGSAITVAARMPIFAQGLTAPNVAAMEEWNEACHEKVAAFWEGSFAASTAWQSMMMRAAFQPPSLTGMAHDLIRITNKAVHPTHKRVKANAARLTKRKLP